MRRKPLSDRVLFPFGEHRGKPMIRVPASYLAWLRYQPVIKDWPEVADYIERPAKAIEWEVKLEAKMADVTPRAGEEM